MNNFIKIFLLFLLNFNVFSDDFQPPDQKITDQKVKQKSVDEYQWVRIFTYTLSSKKVNLKGNSGNRTNCIIQFEEKLEVSFKGEDDFLVKVQGTQPQDEDFCLKDDQIDLSTEELNEIIASQKYNTNIVGVDEFYVNQYVYYKKNSQSVISTFWHIVGQFISIYAAGAINDCNVYYGDLLKVIAFSENGHYVLVEGLDTLFESFACQKGEGIFLPKEDLAPVPSAMDEQINHVDKFQKGQIVYHGIAPLLVYAVASDSVRLCNIRYGEKLEIQGFSHNRQLVLAEILPTGVHEDGRFYMSRMYERDAYYDKKISFRNDYDPCQRGEVVFILIDRLETEAPFADIVFDTNINFSYGFHKNEEVYISDSRYDFAEFHTIHSRVCRVHFGSKVRTILFSKDWPPYALVELLEQKGVQDEPLHRIAPLCLNGDQIISPMGFLSGPKWLLIHKGFRFLHRNFFSD